MVGVACRPDSMRPRPGLQAPRGSDRPVAVHEPGDQGDLEGRAGRSERHAHGQCSVDFLSVGLSDGPNVHRNESGARDVPTTTPNPVTPSRTATIRELSMRCFTTPSLFL